MPTKKPKEKGLLGMNTPAVVSPKEWEDARQQMLVKEKVQMRARDALVADRRRMPWMAVYLVCCLASSVVIGCWKGANTQTAQVTQVPYRPVANPIAEMCTDDTESITDYFNVPVIRFEGPRIELNGTSTSANDLLTWALKRYTNLPEQAVWVQFSPENKPTADQALLPIVKALPRLQIRRADFNFRCPKAPTPR